MLPVQLLTRTERSVVEAFSLRAPLATERLSLLPVGRLLYWLKHRWRDGTTHVIYDLELVERLAALLPPPRFNLTRYSWVLAPAAHGGCQGGVATAKSESCEAKDQYGRRPRNYPWAQLMARVFEFDVLACPRCGARMRILAAINAPDPIRKILACLGLPTRAPLIEQALPYTDEAVPW